MRQSNLFIASFILGAAVLLFMFSLAALSPEPTPDKNLTNLSDRVIVPLKHPTLTFGNPTLGPKDAAVTIFSFGDYECGPCASVDDALKEVLKDYPKDVRVVWKDMPNGSIHAQAIGAAAAARCAGDQGAFWQYHDLLMKQQASLDAKNYPTFAAQLGLDLDSFQSCVDAKRDVPMVNRDLQEGVRLGIDATPYLFINDRVVKGDVGLEQIQAYVDGELAKLGKPIIDRSAK
jgi:protein-disulfide isomerase